MISRRIRFEARHPAGVQYCGKLRAALRDLGLATGSDLLVEGSDNAGFLVAIDRATLNASKAILKRQISGPDPTDVIVARMRAVGVYEIFQDWRGEPSWKTDAAALKKLGVQLRFVSDSDDGEGLIFEVRRAERSKQQVQGRTKRR